MRVFPAIDLRGGASVQLVGGAPDAEKIRLPDPVEVAKRFKAAGFRVLHVVDLDAALGTVTLPTEPIARRTSVRDSALDTSGRRRSDDPPRGASRPGPRRVPGTGPPPGQAPRYEFTSEAHW